MTAGPFSLGSAQIGHAGAPLRGAQDGPDGHLLQLEGGQGNQQKVAGIIIDLTLGEGKPLVANDLGQALKNGFPEANIGDRHAAHYLSKARTGHLPCVREGLVVPTAPRQSKPKPVDAAPAADVVSTPVAVEPSTPAEALAAAAG